MFCSIEDAWGEKTFTDKPLFKQSDKPEHFTTQYDEPITNGDNTHLYSKYMELKEMFDGGEQIKQTQQSTPHHHHHQQTTHNSTEVCDAVDAHIAKCSYCRAKYMGHRHSTSTHRQSNQQFGFGGFDINQLNMSIKSNKDIITIFLFGLLVILLLQLLSK